MSSQQYRLEKLAAKRALGKKAIVRVAGVPYDFGAVVWGGTSPRVALSLGGQTFWHSAAEWTKLGAKF